MSKVMDTFLICCTIICFFRLIELRLCSLFDRFSRARLFQFTNIFQRFCKPFYSSFYLSKFNEKAPLFNKYFQFLKIIPRFILIYPPFFDQFFYITALAGSCLFHFKGALPFVGNYLLFKKTVRLLSDGLSLVVLFLAVLFLAVCYSVFFSSSTTLPSLSFSCKPFLVVW